MGTFLAVRSPQTLAERNVSDVDEKSVPVRSVNGDCEADPVPILVEGDSVDLYHLNPPVNRDTEEIRFDLVGNPDFDCVAVPGLLNATFA